MILQKTHKISFHFYDTGGGDAIHIRFLGDDYTWHNILIDGGYSKQYKYAFGPLIKEILASDEVVDHWIVSHIDRDHIGAVLGFLQDKTIKDKPNTVKSFIFNSTSEPIQVPGEKIAVRDGITLRQYIKDNYIKAESSINTKTKPIRVHGLQITILSPTPEKQEKAEDLWADEERSMKIGRSASQSDHAKTIAELKDLPFHEDTEEVNGSSIAILLEFGDIRALLLADSHPSDIVDSLSALRYSSANPIPISFMQLAHHGSKANTSPGVLSMVKTNNFVVTGNGVHNRHPDKETLVRLLEEAKKKEEKIKIHFVCDTPELRDLFKVDTDVQSCYEFECTFRQIGPENKYLLYSEITD
ncbi:hypothetical protein CEQ15_11710 [Chryseobacterium indologenes]|uniref:ComEC/Rec2 family competence protein n=1 Tax=Chryseobacterium indologenes TaxID=253 RepID=UPI000B5159B7|nr:MBL fold metallo-hydrolase [Chryseobacterium indologenes]ASE62111.1 hypothetical protein CEQ15_11710 [Chryseobacterium indologenes]